MAPDMLRTVTSTPSGELLVFVNLLLMPRRDDDEQEHDDTRTQEAES